MKKLSAVMLLFSVMLALTSTASAAPATIVIRPGENWVAAPLVPFDPAPQSVFAACISQSTLKRLDAVTETVVAYPSPEFGIILLGDGFKMYNPTQTTFYCTYNGVPDHISGSASVPTPPPGSGTSMWLALPGSRSDGIDAGGMHWIGQPFYHDTPWDAVRLSDGTRMLTFEGAVSEGWIDGLWNYMDAETQTLRTFGLPSLRPYDTYLRATHAYEVRTHRDNLALIIMAEPAIPVPEPGGLVVLAMGCLGALRLRRRRRA